MHNQQSASISVDQLDMGVQSGWLSVVKTGAILVLHRRRWQDIAR